MPTRSFRDKIDKIQEITGLAPTAMEEKAGLGQGTITKKYRANEEMSPNMTRIFLAEFGISKAWWDDGKGEILEKKSTYVELPKDNQPNMPGTEEMYRNLVESNTDYRLVPKTILDEEYRIVLKSEIEDKQKMMLELLKAKDDLIVQLKDEIKELRATSKLADAKDA